MDLILIRHPAVALDAGICYGRSDVALADSPAAGAQAVAARLAGLHTPAPQRLSTSPLSRCAAVAAALAGRLGCAYRVDARLAEMDFGAWELQRWDQIGRAALDAWAADFHDARPHGGESVTQFAARVQDWLDTLLPGGSEPVYAVTHAGVMRVAAALTLGVPVSRTTHWSLAMAGIAWLRRDACSAQWSLVRWNA